MVMSDAKLEVNGVAPETGAERSLHAQVSEGMQHAAGRWLKEHSHLDVRKERMEMWQRIHDALPAGKLKEFHGKGQWLAELDAKVAGWSGGIKDTVWVLARDVIAAEVPLVMFLPGNTPSVIDALSAQASGFIGEKAIQGTVAAVEGVKGARGRIDAAMASILQGPATKSVPVGGAA